MEFLFDNPLLLFIILALISAAFKREGSREEKRKTVPPGNPFPEPEPLDIPEPKMIPDFEPEQDRRAAEMPPPRDIFREERIKIEEKLAELEKQESELAEKAELIKQAARRHLREEGREQAERRRGILDLDQKPGQRPYLSEVLGPPRAKAPPVHDFPPPVMKKCAITPLHLIHMG